MSSSKKADLLDKQIAQDMAGFYFDPLGFVNYAYPWGKEGTFLADFDGPDQWQRDTLNRIGENMEKAETTGEPTRILRRSGHEIGKTACISWIIQWFMSTRINPVGVITANTAAQLSSKTWRELAKWHGVMLHAHWFSWTATRYSFVAQPETWFAAATPWTKERSESFAGTHEKGGVLMVFDEGSRIEDVIYEVADGAMDAGSLWVVFGNPTRNQGRFYENAVGKFRHRWDSERIDSRDSKVANQARIQQWITDWGINSDYVKVRVLGEFPSASDLQFIPSDIVRAAAGKTLNPDTYKTAPKIIGVDVARFGDDQSVIIKRQGMAAFDTKKYRGTDLMTLASLCAQEYNIWQPDAMFVDATGGYGAAVVDRLRQIGIPVMEVQFGGASNDPQYANKRAEIWGNMRDWLKLGGCIPDDEELKSDLTGVEYGFNVANKLLLEKKEDMKARGLASPDVGDALACTFAEPVLSKAERERAGFAGVRPTVGVGGKPQGSLLKDVMEQLRRKKR